MTKSNIIDDDPTSEAMKEIISPKKTNDTYSYQGWLISDYFHRRALAVLGYSMVLQLWIGIGIIVVVFIASFFGY